MNNKGKKIDIDIKVKSLHEVLEGRGTVREIAEKHGYHPKTLYKFKRENDGYVKAYEYYLKTGTKKPIFHDFVDEDKVEEILDDVHKKKGVVNKEIDAFIEKQTKHETKGECKNVEIKMHQVSKRIKIVSYEEEINKLIKDAYPSK